MARLIDADALIETMRENAEGNEGWYGDTWAFMRDVDNAPTIDAVPVVRCKDCKHLKASMGKVIVNGEEEVFIGDSWCSATYPMVTVFNMDHFCSYGERKANE